ncbi:MAG: DUF4350 domain-containing protein [Hyphomonadaceae bacterium]|nr:DUF4350 domain-containing protein [Hyphomonadaceae bacterium]
MSERLPQDSNPFSALTSAIMIGVGLLAFIAIFALLAWSPDLASKNRAGQHPYSNSALGYAGLVKLLEADGQTVTVSRLASSLEYSDGLLVLTIPRHGMSRAPEFDLESVSEPALYILPKWSGFADREKPSWQKDTDLLDRESVASIAQAFDSDMTIWRLRNPGRVRTPFGSQRPTFEHQMQVLESDSLEAIISTPGGALLAKIPGRDVYILSDPDLVNTFGLARSENARMALGLVDWLKYFPDQAVTFDATIHGFERSESLLRAIFDVPFLGATMIALATMVLITWGAFIRFGPPTREDRIFAFGKKALAESSAGLISMARRESQMAPGYAQTVQRDLMKRLGLPPHTSPEAFAQTADRIAKQKDLSSNWSQQKQQLDAPTAGRNELRDKALALWRWRKEMSDGN